MTPHTMDTRIPAAFAMAPELLMRVFGPSERSRLHAVLDIDLDDALGAITADAEFAASVELLITGWGAPTFDDEVLQRFPKLRAIVHWGGGVHFLDGDVAGIQVASCRWANAIPVARYTVALITLAAKNAFWGAQLYRQHRRRIDRETELPLGGLDGTRVGIVGASTIGSLVIEALRDSGLEVLVYDPYLTDARAKALQVERVDDLLELASRSEILSIHVPELPETRELISRSILQSLPDNSTIINTSRGGLIDQHALADEVANGRLFAILDVTEPDVLPANHALYNAPNVFLTPHLAGSLGNELRRLGVAAVEEVERFAAGMPFRESAPGYIFAPAGSGRSAATRHGS